MSASTDRISTGSQAHHVNGSQPRSLPAFTSIHDQSGRRISHAESSASGSRFSEAQSNSNSPSDVKEMVTKVTSNGGSSPIMNGSVRRKNRSSGGFLLEPTAQSSRLSRTLLWRRDTKGKGKSEKAEQSGSKKSSESNNRDQSSSVRASPLSTEIRRDAETEAESHHSALPANRNYKNLQLDSPDNSQPQSAASVGFDTDPAQIVEMALRLSEGRRRKVSGKRYVSGTGTDRRVVSTASSLPPHVVTPRSNVDEQQRPVQGKSTVIVQPRTPQRDGILSTSPKETFSNTASPEHDIVEVDEDMQISRATAKRVERAKAYFELAYEHRRLISHLPPLRRPTVQPKPGTPTKDSKAYNPLQYSRNRKLRFRERCPINSEEDGWHDLQKVRNWVDAVLDSHTETRHDPFECVRLPPLSLQEDEELNSEDEQPKAVRSPLDGQKSKPRRPKSDWVTHPGDLIADAHWLEQGLNKLKICDRNNEPIYPPDTQFRFSGWRNRTPVDVPQSLQNTPSSPELPENRASKPGVSALPDLPTFESAHGEHSWAKRRSKFKQALIKGEVHSKRKGLGIFESSDEASSPSTLSEDEDKKPRGRRHLSKHREDRKFKLLDGDPFARPVATKTYRSWDGTSPQSSDIDRSYPSSKKASMDRGVTLRDRKKTGTTKYSHEETSRGRNLKKRDLLHNILPHHHENDAPRSSFEYDTTAPSSPAVYGFPSIAVNLSPAGSRSQSPRKREKSNIIDAVKDKLHHSKERSIRGNADNITKIDSGDTSTGHTGGTENSSKDGSRAASPMTRGLSPFNKRQHTLKEEEPPAPADHRVSTISKLSSRTADSGSTRIRGMFKGGRIAELVGNEVSRVGDYIWKREPPKSVTDSGSSSGYESDSEVDVDEHTGKTSPQETRPAASKQSTRFSFRDTERSPTNPPTIREPQPQYHIPNLPSFTSPFQRDRLEQARKKAPQSPGGTLLTPEDHDHISRLAVQHRTASKSPRLDRLAPPKLTISGSTPPNGLVRTTSYGFGEALERAQSASASFNEAIRHRSMSAEPTIGRSLAISPEDSAGTRNRDGRIAFHDVARTRALLLMTAVKATKIVQKADEVPNPQSKFLLESLPSNPNSELWSSIYPLKPHEPLHVSRREEHVFAARSHIATLKSHSDTFNTHLDSFSSNTAQELHRQLQILDDRVQQEIMPRVRAAADEAGELSQKLTTTSTMAVKAVNDQVVEAMRFRRRGPVRWIRRLGYATIEWAVVGLLWLIWFVVTTVRVVLGVVNWTMKTARWLFWIDQAF